MKRILFVCLGNICRSSSAEEIMRTLVKRAGLQQEIDVDSAGILNYHQGELPDSNNEKRSNKISINKRYFILIKRISFHFKNHITQ